MSSAQKRLAVLDAYAVKNGPHGTQVSWNTLHTAPVTQLESCWTVVSPYSHFICSLQGSWSRMNAAGQREGRRKMAIPVLLIFSSMTWAWHFFLPWVSLWSLIPCDSASQVDRRVSADFKQEESHLAIMRKICEPKALLFLRRQQRSQFYQINQIKCKLLDLQGLGNPVRSKLFWVFLSCVLLTGLVPHGESGMPLFNEVLLVTSGRTLLED